MAGRTTIAGRYELEELPLARGGMGEVWVGRDTRLEREIAVKFLRFPDGQPDDDLVRRFVRESRIAARLEHPGVPAVYDVGTHDHRPYIVMQRIRGVSVSDVVAEHGPLPVGWAAAVAAQVCSVLAVAHAASLVHRDLKPANLMLTPDGAVKVLDFGLAVGLDGGDLSRITRTGQALGTPSYMAPEQVLAGMSDPRTDLYALGCTLHEMLTGRPLFSGSTAYTVMHKQVGERPRPLRRLRPDLPDDLDRLVLALLEKRPEDRPADAGTVYRLLLPFVTGLAPLPGVLAPASTPSPTRMYAGVLARVVVEDAAPAAAGEGARRGNPAAGPARTGAPDPSPADGARPAAPGGARDGVPGGAPGGVAAGVREPRFTRHDLGRARDEAAALVRQSRYSQAAEVLAAAAEPAARALGATDPDVVGLRRELADVLFEGGDYRGAAPAYRSLAVDLAGRDAYTDLVFRSRLQEATCNALLGQTGLALRQLQELRDDEQHAYGHDDPRVLDLRLQIGLLQLGSGQGDAADATLQDLLATVVRRYGPEHPTARRIRELRANRRGGTAS